MVTASLRALLVDPEGVEREALLVEGGQAVLVGRAPENDIQVISPYISRRHAELSLRNGVIHFRDLRSTSGSYLDGRRVTEVELRPGQSVRLGSPDGIRLAIRRGGESLVTASGPSGESAVLTASGHTEVLQVAALDSSPYLSGLLRTPTARAQRRNSSKKTEDRLLTLIALTQDLLGVTSADALASTLLSSMMELLPVERGMVLLGEGGDLRPTRWLVRGEGGGSATTDLLSSLSLEVGASDPQQPELPFKPIGTVVDRVIREGVGLLTLDAPSDQRLEGSKSIFIQSVHSILAVPLSTGEGVMGVLYLDTRRTLRKEDADALDFLMAVGRQAGMVLRQLDLLERQKRMLESMMRALAASIDKRDGLTAGHSARVAHYSVGTANALSLPAAEVYATYYAALLHDYGKIGVDDAVLRKPASLTPEEYAHIQLHPRITFDILNKIEFPPELADLALMAASHHERMDGGGYPFGLVGEEIPLASRIIAIADVYDSLTRKRHYREPMPMAEVLAHLEEGRGDRFDPLVLDAFFSYQATELADREVRRDAKHRRQSSADEHTTNRHPRVSGGRATATLGHPLPTSVPTAEVELVEPTLRLEP